MQNNKVTVSVILATTYQTVSVAVPLMYSSRVPVLLARRINKSPGIKNENEVSEALRFVYKTARKQNMQISFSHSIRMIKTVVVCSQ